LAQSPGFFGWGFVFLHQGIGGGSKDLGQRRTRWLTRIDYESTLSFFCDGKVDTLDTGTQRGIEAAQNRWSLRRAKLRFFSVVRFRPLPAADARQSRMVADLIWYYMLRSVRKTHMRFSSLIFVVVWSAACGLPMAPGFAADAPDIPIDELLSDIQTALVKVRDASDVDALPTLTAVHLTLRAALTREANGSLKFHILEAGAKGSEESIQELRLQLRPPQAADKSPVSKSVIPLADAIIDAAREVKKAATRNPPLHLTTLEASVEFTVEKEASGSIVFFGAKAGNRNTQKIILTFGKSE
jgi:hypothetical protein